MIWNLKNILVKEISHKKLKRNRDKNKVIIIKIEKSEVNLKTVAVKFDHLK